MLDWEFDVYQAKNDLQGETDPVRKLFLENYVRCHKLGSKITEINDAICNDEIEIEEAKKLPKSIRKSLQNSFDELKEVMDGICSKVGNENSYEGIAYKRLGKCFSLYSSKVKQVFIGEADNAYREEFASCFNIRDGFFYVGTYSSIPYIHGGDGYEYYFYPNYYIRCNEVNRFGQYTEFKIMPYQGMKASFSTFDFEEDSSMEVLWPNDSKFVRWNNSVLNGRVPVFEYGLIELQPLGIILLISNADKAKEMSAAINELSEANNTMGLSDKIRCFGGISKQKFDDISNAVKSIWNFMDNSLFVDQALRGFIRGSFDNNVESIIRVLVTKDLIDCFERLGHTLDFDKPESLAIFLFFNRDINAVFCPNYEDLDSIFESCNPAILKGIQELYDSTVAAKGMVGLIPALKHCHKDLVSQYVVLLYRFSSIIAKVDNSVTKEEAGWLETIMSWKNDDDNSDVSATKQVEFESPAVDFANGITELDSLIGLSTVKQEISTLKNYITIQQERVRKGLRSTQVSYHCIFIGNPGTGKTTVARIVAKIYHDLGVLKKGHLIETDRSGLVAEFVGQTAVKTNKIIDSALDGVLFIDEAYSLIEGGDNDYGKEAIATLLKRMEDDRDRLVVVLAGYSDEMKRFIDSNPGLQSRFNRCIDFPDYTEDELYQIFESNCKKFDYTISTDASAKLKDLLHEIVMFKDKNFGNGRFVRNVFEKTIEKQANRLSKIGALTTEMLSLIEVDDLAINLE